LESRLNPGQGRPRHGAAPGIFDDCSRRDSRALSLLAAGIPFAETPRYAFNATQAMTQMMISGPFLMMIGLDTIAELKPAFVTRLGQFHRPFISLRKW
jgi:hypothetical protein